MADVSSLIQYYQGLTILQYQGQPQALAHVGLLAQAALLDGIHIDALSAFNINPKLGPTAVGQQLDLIGELVGASRSGQGQNGPVTLGDSDYLLLIQIKIIQNRSDSSLASIQSLLQEFFPGQIRVFDHLSMRMSYFIQNTLGGSQLPYFFVYGGYLPKPAGVQNAMVTSNSVINSFFGFRTVSSPGFNITPMNSAASYNQNWKWLSAAMGIEG